METASAISKVHQRPRPLTRCKGSEAEQSPVSTAGFVTDGFLRHQFMPMYSPVAGTPERSAVEGDFYMSLGYLQAHYGIEVNGYREEAYPYNILLAELELNRKLCRAGRYRELQILEQENERTCLSVKENLSDEFVLYFIPVMPIYDLWQKPEYQPCARLLTAVCAYLYCEAGVSYYRDEETYMWYNYETLKDWMEDDRGDADEDDYEKQKTAIADAQVQGDFIQEKMMATGFRQSLWELVAGFEASTDFEKNCHAVARACLELWRSFAKRSICDHANLQDYEVIDYEDNYIGMHEYISFVGSTNDRLSDGLMDMVNNDFNERARYQEPEVVTFFDEAQPAYSDELVYEQRLFELIDDLCSLLNQKP